ncbi:L-selectin-like [Perca fluviatilis]|uniref:L-selectin-like n=1 Tax=Perca fluviatilis TaxID=8168 RepID=UPI001962FD2C|nr:L-selectin-like [Perca fluviatilis]
MVKMQWSLFVFIVMGQCSSIGGHLYDYHFIGEKKTWKEAQEYCRKYHTDLATVANQTDMQRLQNHPKYQAGAWIGLHENTTKIVWRWSQPEVVFSKSEREFFVLISKPEKNYYDH